MTAPHREISWRKAVAVYLAGSAGLHLIWETLQLPLYTIWRTGTNFEIAFAVIHCTAGDVMIAAVSLVAAVLLLQHRTWPPQNWVPMVVATLVCGIAITIYSEWLNTVIRKTWAYSDLMPTLPFLGTGLAPMDRGPVTGDCGRVLAHRPDSLKHIARQLRKPVSSPPERPALDHDRVDRALITNAGADPPPSGRNRSNARLRL